MCRKKRALMLFLTLIAGLTVSAMITVRQLPDELVIHHSGSTQLNTFLPVSVEINDSYSDSAKAKLFGMVGVKDVGIRREEPKKVTLAGTLFGLRMYSDGVMVVGLSDFESNGKKSQSSKGLRHFARGDYPVSERKENLFQRGIRKSRDRIQRRADAGAYRKRRTIQKRKADACELRF